MRMRVLAAIVAVTATAGCGGSESSNIPAPAGPGPIQLAAEAACATTIARVEAGVVEVRRTEATVAAAEAAYVTSVAECTADYEPAACTSLALTTRQCQTRYHTCRTATYDAQLTEWVAAAGTYTVALQTHQAASVAALDCELAHSTLTSSAQTPPAAPRLLAETGATALAYVDPYGRCPTQYAASDTAWANYHAALQAVMQCNSARNACLDGCVDTRNTCRQSYPWDHCYLMERECMRACLRSYSHCNDLYDAYRAASAAVDGAVAALDSCLRPPVLK